MSIVKIFDTTLRDGLQASKRAAFPQERIEIAYGLADLGVNIIEAGFPASYEGDEEVVRKIAEEVGRGPDSPVICGLARCVQGDIEAVGRAIKPAENKRVHVFIATSPIHMEYKLKMEPDQVVENAIKSVKFAKEFCDDVEFSLEDYSRTEPEFAQKISIAAIDAGATTINLPDTVGYALPTEFYKMVKGTIEGIRKNGRDAVFSVHTHNDLGLATANTIMGIYAGARQAEVTVNGVGERAGNAALEELAMSMRTKEIKDDNEERLATSINPESIRNISEMISKYFKMVVQPNKAIIGEHAFKHKSGIHQDGMVKHGMAYEIMTPEDCGYESRLEFGPHSGSAGLGARYEELGIKFKSDADLVAACKRFYKLVENREAVDDVDLVMAANGDYEVRQRWTFKRYHPMSFDDGRKGMLVEMDVDGEHKEAFARGVGPVDAGLNAIRKVMGKDYKLEYFKEASVTTGSDSDARARMVIRKNRWEAIEHGQAPDIIETAFLAFTGAANRMNYLENHFKN
jgi:2-isopropylmalate synthase